MTKNRMMRPRVPGERARDGEAHIHQGCWWQMRRWCVESGRAYQGRSAVGHGRVTEDIARCSDGMAEVSRGRSSRSSGEGPNDRKGQ